MGLYFYMRTRSAHVEAAQQHPTHQHGVQPRWLWPARPLHIHSGLPPNAAERLCPVVVHAPVTRGPLRSAGRLRVPTPAAQSVPHKALHACT